jgi:hypothetical protein
VFKVVTNGYNSGNIRLQISLKVEHILGSIGIDLNDLANLIYKSYSKILQKEYVHEANLYEIEHTDFIPIIRENLERHENLAHPLLPLHLGFKRQNVLHKNLNLFILTNVICNLWNLLSRGLGKMMKIAGYRKGRID